MLSFLSDIVPYRFTSQISTITGEFLDQLQPNPNIFNLEDLNLDVKVAGEYSQPYKGLISIQTSVLFVKEKQHSC